MGIVSWIKDTYYDNRLKRANKMLSEGYINEAVNILNEILDKHPNAPFVL